LTYDDLESQYHMFKVTETVCLVYSFAASYGIWVYNIYFYFRRAKISAQSDF